MHNHSHDHSHHFDTYNRSFAIAVVLNILFVVIEAVYGVVSGSLALLADAGHNLSDVMGLLMAWEAIQRLTTPAEVAGLTVVVVAGIGVLINGATMMLFLKGPMSTTVSIDSECPTETCWEGLSYLEGILPCGPAHCQ